MKKGVIAISLLIAGGLLFTPIKNASFAKDMKDNAATAKVETTTEKTQSSNEAEDKTTQSEEVKQPIKEETTAQEETTVKEQTTSEEDATVKEESKEESKNETTEVVTNENKEEEQEDTGMTKSQAEQILDKYIEEVEQSDFTYTYQGDENTFDAIKEKGIRGYVFLPNLETDMAYLVDKDNGNIYFFHPSGYFELLQ